MKHNGKKAYGEKGSTSRSSCIVAKKPHFFRIILTPQHRQMLEIPAKFVNEFRESLHNSVHLRVPASAEYWKVGLVKSEGKVWLQSGLQDFLDHHSVMCGHFLVFRYNGDSIFRVIIFDTSATEIDYPISVSIRSGSVKRDLQDGFLASSKKQKNESLPCRMTETPNQKQISKRKCAADVEDSIALRRAKAFECDKPSFIVLMRRTYVLECFRLWLPAAHTSEYLKGQNGKEVFLHRPDGETWPVKCHVPNPSNVFLTSGWKEFVLDNKLQVGDVCVFEMFSQVPNHYNVIIFREPSPYRMTETPNQMKINKRKCIADGKDSIALRRAKAFECDKPSFIVLMRRSYIVGFFRVRVPAAHSSKYLKGQHGMKAFLHRPDGGAWPVKCYAPNSSKVKFTSGWKDFVLDNELQEGDVCVFEMFSQVPNHYKVTIFRESSPCKTPNQMHTGKRKCTADVEDSIPLERAKAFDCDKPKKPKKELSPCRKQISKRKCTSYGEDSLALRRAKAFECNEPSFIVLMRRSHVVEFFRVWIPAVHASEYLKDQHGNEVFLHRPDGETWPVKCYVPKPSEARFSSGWKDFVLDNELEEGDVCVFEMFSQVPNHYKVTIFRCGESSGAN